MLLANNPFELQTLMNYSSHNADIQFFENHPTKSAVTTLLQQKSSLGALYSWMLGNKPAMQKSVCEHLGLLWMQGALAPRVDNKVTLARRTSFALTCIGIHDKGINPIASIGTIQCYVEPSLLTGLNATVLNSVKIKELDRFYHKLVRQIQGIPMNAAKEATYIFLNTLPVESLHHLRIMEMFGQICRLPENHTVNNVAMRQLAVKTDKSKSWFIHSCKIGEHYGLNLYQEFQNPSTQLAWKNTVKKAIYSQCFTDMVESAKQKSTLEWVLFELLAYDHPHSIWTESKTLYQTEAARTRLKMLVGRYGFGKEIKRYVASTDTQCPMCTEEVEDVEHFLTNCPPVLRKTGSLVNRLSKVYTDAELTPPCHRREIVSAILNGAGYQKYQGTLGKLTGIVIKLPKGSIKQASLICNHIVSTSHSLREEALGVQRLECIKCKVPVEDDDRAITCDDCERWQHIACNNIITDDEYDNALDGTSNLEWCCPRCTNAKSKA